MPGPRSTPARLAAQVQGIRAAFGADGVTIRNHPPGVADGYTNFLFRADRVLTQTADIQVVQDALADQFGPGVQITVQPSQSVPDLVALEFRDQDSADIDAVVTRLNATGRVVASYDHIIHITSSSCCPATEPQLVGGPGMAPAPDPAVNADASLGQNVKVAVIDTGILHDVVNKHPWLKNPSAVRGDQESPKVGIYTGHGTFVAGVLRTMAPAAEVYVHSMMSNAGAISEYDLAPLVMQVIDTDQPHIVSMSAGTRTTGENLLLGFEALRAKLAETGTVLVCAAGNDGDFGPFAPASLPWSEAVSVGALDADEQTLAPYSNHGPDHHDWVDVYARGSDVVNAYPDGDYTYTIPPRSGQSPQTVRFENGMALWDGTSFSTPLVAGIIAARMSWSGESATVAAQRLLNTARVVNGRKVLSPGDGDNGVNLR